MATIDKESFDVDKVLVEEFKLLHGDDAGDGSLAQLYEKIHALAEDGGDGRSALCLSGGGIRSASFGLGVLQALANRGVLFNFHYLSTVSGGGYIGSWLTAWRRRMSDEAVKTGLTKNVPHLYEEPPELAELRANSNYLTPKLGVMSADTWTLAALYIRNLLLNWLIFLPAIVAILLVPIVSYQTLTWAQDWGHSAHYWLAGISITLLFIALTASVSGRFDTARLRWTQNQFLWFILLPTYGGAALLALSVVSRQVIVIPPEFSDWLRSLSFFKKLLWLGVVEFEKDNLTTRVNPVSGAVIGAVLYLLSWVLAYVLSKLLPKKAVKAPFPWRLMGSWFVAGAVFGCLLAVGYGLVRASLGTEIIADAHVRLLTVLGVGWVALSMYLAESVYLGLASRASDGDVNREWLARSSGWFVAFAIGWAVLSALVLFSDMILAETWRVWTVAAAGAGAGVVGSWIGSSAKTLATAAGKRVESLSMSTILSLATVIFLAALTILISHFLPAVVCAVHKLRTGLDCPQTPDAFGYLACSTSWVIVAFVFAAGFIAFFVNVNRFSSHAIYRNRLIRGFLGAARAKAKKKQPTDVRAERVESPTRDPFTGFDAEDNQPMTALMRPEGQNPRLFHVINMALNVVGGQNLAWQERKAESFTASPLFCGNDHVKFKRTGSYASTTGGLTIGTAMAISGAAASPNQGYHSSPLVGLLMALFNVRLGWWLGNPSHPHAASREGPRWGIVQIVQELFQLTTDRSKYVYLSDGGHFENLGIYEMVRRRCHLIVASDAGADPDCAFEDLGNAVRKVWIDLGVKIDFHRIDIKKRTSSSKRRAPAPGLYCAIGTIKYPEDDTKDGYLLYLKPGFPSDGSLPADVSAYGLANPTFPHETTADQFFSESQMESYRSLGSHIIDVVFGPEKGSPQSKGPTTAIGPFWEHIKEYVKPKTT
ncbi:Patatin-like phospholipase [Rhodospirillales bacterium URHD0017]|nr:Patatin-like phospholipase [Rhodospirillales bacterium URHD0017]